ncbi:hypothetical protein B0J11DRAFT_308335 [Dendryphion nanum]|uniref:FAD/NAD(P)-binding domain-containing protein n=1 Tax=Dendryphion nanum TaxID=256645 RepID=A0A9P9DUY0_9PLEO|nr:hypothetical protein B0J11DRAFT_308335 [Dendryphion nanum]
MSSQRNIVVLGGSISGLGAAHYTLKHILPALKAKNDGAKYHVYLIDASRHWYFRPAAPRVSTSTSLLAAEKVLFDIESNFQQYSADDFTFIQARASGLDPDARKVKFIRSKSLTEEELPYHALVVATGSRTYAPSLSTQSDSDALLNSIKTMNDSVSKAQDITIIGGGPSSIETAAEIGEFRNGKPGWFSTPPRQANITLITASPQLLPNLRADIAKTAEKKLKDLGVDVVYNTRIVSTKESGGKTTITLSKGDTITTDLYVPALGVLPNSDYIPSTLLDSRNYIITNGKTLRVDAAGPRVYSIGDVASYSGNNVFDILNSQPVLHANLTRDLLSFDAANPAAKPRGKDREFKPSTSPAIVVPVGTAGGVGQAFGWRIPSFLVYFKARDYMLGMSGVSTASGGGVAKAVKLTAEERV